MSVQRFDVGRMSRAKPIAGGGVSVPAFLTRIGVFEYRRADGSVQRELRLPEEVFAEDSLSTLRYAPVTDLHPNEMVTIDNRRQLEVGVVAGTAEKRDSYVASELVITDKKTIDAINAGTRKEISCGYTCDLEFNQGTHNGERYDAIQRSIRYNHVALGPENWGRAGSEVAIRLDSGAAFAVLPEPHSKQHERKATRVKAKYRIDGVDFEVEAEESTHQAIGKALARVDSTIAERDREKGRADAAEQKLTEATKRLDGMGSAVDAAVNARLELRGKAAAMLGSDYKYDGKSDRDVMIDAIKVGDPNFDPKPHSDDYLRGRFDNALSTRAADVSAGTAAAVKGATKVDAANDDYAKTYDKYYQDQREAWKKPLAYSKDRA